MKILQDKHCVISLSYCTKLTEILKEDKILI